MKNSKSRHYFSFLKKYLPTYKSSWQNFYWKKIRHFLCFKMDHIHTTVLLLLLPLELNYYYVFTWVKLWYLISFLFCLLSFEPPNCVPIQMYPLPPCMFGAPPPVFYTDLKKNLFKSDPSQNMLLFFRRRKKILCTLLLSILNKAVIWYLKTPQE